MLMASQAIDLSSGMVPATPPPTQDQSLDLSAGMVSGDSQPSEPPQQPGVWDTIKNDIKGIFTNIPTVPSPYPGMDEDTKLKIAEQSEANDQRRKAAGYGPVYRAAAPIAEAAGTNVTGMENDAAAGNARGVIGHMIAGQALAAAPLAAEGAVKGVRAAAGAAEGLRPDFLKPTDVLTETTPERIAQLKEVPQKVEAVRQVAHQTEQAARARASASFPKIEKPIQVGTETVIDPTGKADDFGEVSSTHEEPVYTTFKDLQEERSNLLEKVEDLKDSFNKGETSNFELARTYERLAKVDELMTDAAQNEGKLDQLVAARKQWKQYMNDFHNQGSPLRKILRAPAGDTQAVTGSLLGKDGARALETLRRNGANTGGAEALLNRGTRPLQVDVNESDKLRKAGSDQAYTQQRYREALRQTQVNELPSKAEARLPKGALANKYPSVIGEIPGVNAVSPRRVTGFRLQRALDKMTGMEPEAPQTAAPQTPQPPEQPKGSPSGGKPPQPERRVTARNGVTFTEAERQKFLERQAEVHRALNPNEANGVKNPFDNHPSHMDTVRNHERAQDILSGREKVAGESIRP